MKIIPAKGYILIQRKNRDGSATDIEMIEKTNLLPPSIYIVMKANGTEKIKPDTEVLIQGSSRLCPVPEADDLYIMHESDIVAYITK